MDSAQNFIDRSRAYLTDEYRIKLHKTIDALPPEMLWWRPNEQSNSVGNLLMHLEGNVRQWIIGAVGGASDVRNRAGEFGTREGAPREELMRALDKTFDEADAVLASLRPEQLTERRRVQARDVSVLDAVYQVVQHFALHLGQIILVAKAQVPGAVKFYEDAGGAARPIWRVGADR
ncbi:MAG TPA: DinB family protein [Gemmatimonadaceae bacterium]|jgi:uncharacterized damage-inducible protein DinB